MIYPNPRHRDTAWPTLLGAAIVCGAMVLAVSWGLL